MTHFFVDNRAQPDGAHEVHAVGCKRMASDKAYLGDFMSCEVAVLEARKEFWQIAGCVRCLDLDATPARAGAAKQFPLDFPALRAAIV
jgi:hypothetical protein